MENIIKANDGQIFVRKNDEFIMGTTIVLGKNDTIDNYVQRDCTEEEMKVYYKQKEVYNQEVYQKHINEIKERVKAREEEIKKAREERVKAREERVKAREEEIKKAREERVKAREEEIKKAREERVKAREEEIKKAREEKQ